MNRKMHQLGLALIIVFCLVRTAQIAAQALPPDQTDNFTGKPRVIVLSNMGNG